MEAETRTYNLFAYHGTDENSANNIYEKGFRLPTGTRDDHWLGNGIYFYREDELQALIWAEVKIRNIPELRGLKAAVVETNLCVNENNFLNLDTRKGMDFLYDFLKEACLTAEASNIQIILSHEDSKIRHYFFNLLPDIIYVIQRTFKVDSKKIDNNPLLRRMCLYLQGVQLCVRNLSVLVENPRITMQKDVEYFNVQKPATRKSRRIRFAEL